MRCRATCSDNQCPVGGTSQNIFMQQNCKYSCGFCPLITVGPPRPIDGDFPVTFEPTFACADSRPECAEWATQGQCDPAADTFPYAAPFARTRTSRS
jgi:hypothetical protein